MGSQVSDRLENQATEQHLAPNLTTVTVPQTRHQGARSTSSELAKPEHTNVVPRPGPELEETTGGSSQGTDSEPRPPGLLLGVTLHRGPSTQNWRVKGSGGHQSPPSSQKRGRGGAPGAHSAHPSSSPQPGPAPPHLFAKSLPSRSPHS